MQRTIETLTTKPILVTGASGFIGSNLVNKLLELGFTVRGFDRFKPTYSINSSRYEFVEGDFLNSDDIKSAMAGCNIVYHLVSMTLPAESNKNPLFDVRSNVSGTVNFLDIAVESRIKRTIFVSSGGTVYGVTGNEPIPEDHATNPISAYGIGKLAIEKYLALYQHIHQLDYRVLRVANPYGNNQKFNCKQGLIQAFINRINNDQPLEIWGDGSVIRDYIHIDDVTHALLCGMSDKSNETIYNIGSGIGYSINDIIMILEELLGHEIKRNYLDSRAADVPTNILDISRARKHLNWTPRIDLTEGMSRLLENYPNLLKTPTPA